MNVPVVGRIDAGSVPSSTEIETCRYTGVSSRTSISTWCCSESNSTSYISDSDKTVRSSSYDFSDHRFISASRTFCHRSRRFISECYPGTWYSNSMSVHSGRSAALALSKGARATFAFNGTAAKWIGYKDPWSGIANVYVDGALKTQVDSYSASGQAQQVLYTITGLSSGSHTLVIEVTGTKNPSAQSAWIWVDAFDFAP